MKKSWGRPAANHGGATRDFFVGRPIKSLIRTTWDHLRRSGVLLYLRRCSTNVTERDAVSRHTLPEDRLPPQSWQLCDESARRTATPPKPCFKHWHCARCRWSLSPPPSSGTARRQPTSIFLPDPHHASGPRALGCCSPARPRRTPPRADATATSMRTRSTATRSTTPRPRPPSAPGRAWRSSPRPPSGSTRRA